MKSIFVFIFFFYSINTSFSQSINSDTSDKVIVLNEAIVSANKVTEQKRDIAQQAEIISSRQIQIANPQNAADLVTQTGLVTAQKSQQGGGSPVMRGFEASRILLMIDGVRMNNIIYRGGHLQNIITLDPSMIDRVELMFGPSSTVYGSDALGGVIHFHTKKPALSETADKLFVKTNAAMRYSTVNEERTGHLDFNIGSTKLASVTSLSYSDFNDLLQGKNLNKTADSLWLRPYYAERINGKDSLVANENIYKQVFSGYSQYDIMQKFLFKQNENIKHLLNLQMSNSSDVPRYDRLTDPDGDGLRFAEWYYGPQFRAMAAYDVSIINQSGFFTDYQAGINYQFITESRHTRRFDSDTRSNRYEDVGVAGFNMSARKKTKQNDLRIGLDGQFNSLESTAEELDIVTGESSTLDTRYPDGSNIMNNIGLYATNTYRINDAWILNAGIRMEAIKLKSTFVNKSFYEFPYDGVEQSHLPLSGSAGVVWNGTSGWRATLMVASGFRAPNVDDLAKVFDSEPGSVVVPNPDLQPEKTFNIDGSITKVFSDKVKIEGVAYYTLFRNAIVTDSYNLNGEDSILYDGTMSAVYANQNKGRAFLYGTNINLFVDFNRHFSLTSTLSYTYGRIVSGTGNAPLDHIAPLFGKTNLIFHQKSFRAEVFAMYNGAKKIEDYYLNGEDNEQYATPEGMPAWWTLNLRLQYSLNKNLKIQVACENILDANYRTFASGISSPGRNFIMGLRANF